MSRPAGDRWTCEQCGQAFSRHKSGGRPIRFCRLSCYHAWRADANLTAGQFVTGLIPWNKGVKGLRLSPATEWKKGQRGRNWMPVGSETVRTCKGGHRRAFVKLAEPNVWRERAIVVWEAVNGPLPEGMVVHHEDRDPLNDDLGNLTALTRAEHLAEHRNEFRREPPKKAVQLGLPTGGAA
tara:strand:- start:9295 stop:9837 length:543 start_codon:yes stop_codon:yes gene_type:complete